MNRRSMLRRQSLQVKCGTRKSKRMRVPRLPDGQVLLRRMFTLSPPSEWLPVRRRARQNKVKRCRVLLPRRPPPLSRMPAHRLLRPFNTRSGPTSRDRTADAAALTIVVDAGDAIAVGDARVAGAIGGRAETC